MTINDIADRESSTLDENINDKCESVCVCAYVYVYMCVHTCMCVHVCIYIKNFAWEDQRQKQCYIVHIARRGVNSAILFVYRTRYVCGKEPEGFQKVFLSPFSAG